MRLRAFATKPAVVRDNIDVTVSLRTGDKAIICGALAIAGYERFVRDDADLISYRVSAYRKHWLGRLIADTVILTTALHLMESVREDLDPYHHAMRWLRRKADTATNLL